jgi:hypothetical protein
MQNIKNKRPNSWNQRVVKKAQNAYDILCTSWSKPPVGSRTGERVKNMRAFVVAFGTVGEGRATSSVCEVFAGDSSSLYIARYPTILARLKEDARVAAELCKKQVAVDGSSFPEPNSLTFDPNKGQLAYFRHILSQSENLLRTSSSLIPVGAQ